MTRLVTTGWETGDINELAAAFSGGGQSVVNATPTPPTPSQYCLRIGNTVATAYRQFPAFAGAGKSDVWVRFAVMMHGITSIMRFILLIDSAGGQQGSLMFNPSDGTIKAYLGATGTQIGSNSSQSMTQDVWYTIDLRWQMSSTSNGTTEVWLNNTRVINFTGDNSNTATLDVAKVELGDGSQVFAANKWMAFDNFAVNDIAGTINNGRIGLGTIVLLTPTAAGSSSALSRGGTDSGANWSQMDETPPSMTDYVYGSTVGNRDLYTMSDVSSSIPIASINAVEVTVFGQNSDGGAGSIAPTIKSGGTTSEATAVALGTATSYVTSRWETDPSTSAAWTLSAVQALEAGVTVR